MDPELLSAASLLTEEFSPSDPSSAKLPIIMYTISLWEPNSTTRNFWAGWHNVPKAPGQTIFAPKWGGPLHIRRIAKEDLDTIVKCIETWYAMQQPKFEYKLEILTVTIIEANQEVL